MHPCNALAVELYLDLWPRWLVWPDGSRRAIDFTQARAAIALRRVPRRQRAGLLEDLQVMERAALRAMEARR